MILISTLDLFLTQIICWCQAVPKVHKRKNKRKKLTGKSESENAWLKKRRHLVDKAVATGSASAAAEAQDAVKLSKDLWCEKQRKELALQRKRDNVNSFLSVNGWVLCAVFPFIT